MPRRSAATLIALSVIHSSPSCLQTPLQRLSMASVHLYCCLQALQAHADAPPSNRTLDNPRTLATHSNIPRQRKLRCASLWLLTPTTSTSIHPVRGLPPTHTCSSVFPPHPASSPSTRHFHAQPSSASHARLRGTTDMQHRR